MIILYVYIQPNSLINFLNVIVLLHIKYPVIIRKQFIPVLPHIPNIHNNRLLMLVGESDNGPKDVFVIKSVSISPEFTTQ